MISKDSVLSLETTFHFIVGMEQLPWRVDVMALTTCGLGADGGYSTAALKALMITASSRRRWLWTLLNYYWITKWTIFSTFVFRNLFSADRYVMLKLGILINLQRPLIPGWSEIVYLADFWQWNPIWDQEEPMHLRRCWILHMRNRSHVLLRQVEIVTPGLDVQNQLVVEVCRHHWWGD